MENRHELAASAVVTTADQPAVFAVGQSLNHRYDIRQQLSAAAGKRTLLAFDRQRQQLVVVKILLFDSEFRWCDFRLFEREAKVLKHLNHPTIPKYLDYFEFSQGTLQGFALVQTYIDALNLEQLVQQGRRFSEVELIAIARQLLELLDELHSALPPVIHRDIKPSNVLLNSTEPAAKSQTDVKANSAQPLQAHLIDFGSVQASATGSPGTITIVGSYGYTPIEQFGGQAVPASDLYSLGMTLLFIATGNHPSELSQSNGRVQFVLPHLSQEFRAWLAKLTQPHVDQRFDSAKVALAALEHTQLHPKRTSQIESSLGGKLHLRHGRVEVIYDNNQTQLTIPLLRQASSRQTSGPVQQNGRPMKQSHRAEEARSPIVKDSFVDNVLSLFEGVQTLLIVLLGLGLLFAFMVGSAALVLVVISLLMHMLTTAGVVFICLTIVAIFVAYRLPISNHNRSDYKLVLNPDAILLYASEEKVRLQNPRKEISLLTYSPGYVFTEFWDSSGTRKQRGKVTIDGELCIYAGQNRYSIKTLTPDEFWWLGQELSAYLNLELQVIYTKPKVPPEPSCGGGC